MTSAPLAFETAAPEAAASQSDQLREMSAQTGRPPGKLAAEFGRLSLGAGKLSFPDYVQFRLFDDAFAEGADKARFAGRRVNSELINDINYDRDAFILATNKLAGAGFLRAYGFPTPETRAVYVRGLQPRTTGVFGAPEALAAFLRTEAAFPLFGKPVGGEQSFGSVLVKEGVGEDGRLALSNGVRLTPEALAAQIDERYPDGYLFQTPLTPPPEIARLTGGALATLRILTVRDGGRAGVLRACLKLPAGGNVADNYWRSGNLLARIDTATGRVLGATRGSGLSLQVVDLAAEFGGALEGLVVPGWKACLDLAEQAQQVIPGLALIGWDVGVTAQGPVFVEINAAPNNLLVQLADRRGLLEPDVLRLAEEGRRGRRELSMTSKKELLSFVTHKG